VRQSRSNKIIKVGQPGKNHRASFEAEKSTGAVDRYAIASPYEKDRRRRKSVHDKKTIECQCPYTKIFGYAVIIRATTQVDPILENSDARANPAQQCTQVDGGERTNSGKCT